MELSSGSAAHSPMGRHLFAKAKWYKQGRVRNGPAFFISKF
jgi:hypothetical protein